MSDSTSSRELSDALDYLAISRLQAGYGDVVSRQAWPELEPLFLPDCPIVLDLHRGEPTTLIGATALGEMVATAIARFEFFEFALLNSVIDVVGVDGDREARTATGRLYLWELRQSTTGSWTNAYGLYQDTYVRHEGRWVIGARRYSSLARTADGALGSHDYDVFDIPGL